MKSSTKLVKRNLLPSPSHLRKDVHQFQFQVTVIRIHNPPPGEFAVKWSRGSKSVQTTTLTNSESITRVLNVGETLSMICTLYRSRSNFTEGPSFLEKDFKMAIVSSTGSKTIAKTHLNIAKYAGVPSADMNDTLKLGSIIKIDLRLVTRLVQNIKSTTKSAVTSQTSDIDSIQEDFCLPESQNNDELGLDDMFSPVTPARKNKSALEADLKQFHDLAETIQAQMKEEQKRCHDMQQMFNTFKYLSSVLTSDTDEESDMANRASATYKEISLSYSEVCSFQTSILQAITHPKGPMLAQYPHGVKNELSSFHMEQAPMHVAGPSSNGQCCDCNGELVILTGKLAERNERIRQLEAEKMSFERRRFVLDMDISEYQQQLEVAKEKERVTLKDYTSLKKRCQELENRIKDDSTTTNQEGPVREKGTSDEDTKKVIRELKDALNDAQSREKDCMDEVTKLTALSKTALKRLEDSKDAIKDGKRGKDFPESLIHEQSKKHLSGFPVDHPPAESEVLDDMRRQLEEKEKMLQQASSRFKKSEKEKKTSEKYISDLTVKVEGLLEEKKQVQSTFDLQLKKKEELSSELEQQNKRQSKTIERHVQSIKTLKENQHKLHADVQKSIQESLDHQKKASSYSKKVSLLEKDVTKLQLSRDVRVKVMGQEISSLKKAEEVEQSKNAKLSEERLARRCARAKKRLTIEKGLESAKQRMEEQERDLDSLRTVLSRKADQSEKRIFDVRKTQQEEISVGKEALQVALRRENMQQMRVEQQHELISFLKEEVAMSSADNRDAQSQFDLLTDNYRELKYGFEGLGRELDVKEKRFTSARDECKSLQDMVTTMKDEMVKQKEHLSTLQTKLTSFDNTSMENTKLKNDIDKMNNMLGPLKARHEELQQEYIKVSMELKVQLMKSGQKEAEATQLVEEKEELSDKCSNFMDQLAHHQEIASFLVTKLARIQEEKEEENEKYRVVQRYCETLKTEAHEVRLAAHGLQSRIKVAEDKLSSCRQEQDQLKLALKEKESFERKALSLEKDLSMLQLKYSHPDKEIELKQLRRYTEELKEKLQEYKTSNFSLLSTITSLESEAKKARNGICEADELKQKVQEISSTKLHLETKIVEIEQELMGLQSYVSDIQTELSAVKEQNSELQKFKDKNHATNEEKRCLGGNFAALERRVSTSDENTKLVAQEKMREISEMKQAFAELKEREKRALEENVGKNYLIEELEKRIASMTIEQSKTDDVQITQETQVERGKQYNQDVPQGLVGINAGMEMDGVELIKATESRIGEAHHLQQKLDEMSAAKLQLESKVLGMGHELMRMQEYVSEIQSELSVVEEYNSEIIRLRSEKNLVEEEKKSMTEIVASLEQKLSIAELVAEDSRKEISKMRKALVRVKQREKNMLEEVARKSMTVGALEARITALTTELKGMKRDVELRTAERALAEMDRQIRRAEGWDDEDQEEMMGINLLLQGSDAKMYAHQFRATNKGIKGGDKKVEKFNSWEATDVQRSASKDSENISDQKLVDMLIETKTKLALAEEGKVQLEHLIHRIQEGDAYMRKKIAEYVVDIDLVLSGQGDVGQLSGASGSLKGMSAERGHSGRQRGGAQRSFRKDNRVKPPE